ncbi:MAG: hypothetical protein A2104_01540 [Candidatus Melainabacteria bacterium GWF2_32_7]|nr:MAG: hypothetical protein A2104_01540 [Candidatus Melainabacteria bacterium GWF2_32_7]
MITLDTNLTLYPGLYYYLPMVKNQNSKAYSAIDQYADTKAAKGTPETQNTQQTNKTNNVPTDYSSLIEMLKLELPANRLEILKLIPHSELLQFLYLLNKDQLVNGLKLFTKERLLQFVSNLSKEQLLKMLTKMYISTDQILEHFSIKEINHFLSSKKIEKSNMLKIFQSLSKVELAQIAEAATGIAQGNKTEVQLLKVIGDLNATQITDGIKGLEYKKMSGIVSEMLKQDAALYNEFTQESLFKQTKNFAKTSLVEGMGTIDSDQLIKFLDKLPNSFLALVATQIDTDLLAQILVNDYQNLLSQIAA